MSTVTIVVCDVCGRKIVRDKWLALPFAVSRDAVPPYTVDFGYPRYQDYKTAHACVPCHRFIHSAIICAVRSLVLDDVKGE